MPTPRSGPAVTRGRPEKREQTRARILDAARAMLAQGEPVAATTVGAVAKAAGVSRATFYLYFPGKFELLDALLGELFEAWTPISMAVLESADASPERVRELVDAVIDRWSERAGVLAGFIELAEYDAQVRASWTAAIGEVGTAIEGWLVLVRPDLAPTSRAALAATLAWSAERALHQLLTDDPASKRTVSDGLTELVCSVARPPQA